MHIGMIGLGRMGAGLTRRLMQHGHTCVVYDRDQAAVAALAAAGATGTAALGDLVGTLEPPRVIWLTTTEVLVTLKRPPLAGLTPGQGNRVRFRLTPPITLGLDTRVKAAGDAMASRAQELAAEYQPDASMLGDYERLLTDAMRGEATLFAREDAVEVAWSIVEPILDDVTPLCNYAPGAWGPPEAERLTADVGGWHSLGPG